MLTTRCWIFRNRWNQNRVEITDANVIMNTRGRKEKERKEKGKKKQDGDGQRERELKSGQTAKEAQ